ncbi:hypothetical protein THAOC_03092, partial [Thalassiosira oceanica]
SDVINGSETSADRARAMVHKFAVTPASLIDNGGRRAIGIALQPQHSCSASKKAKKCKLNLRSNDGEDSDKDEATATEDKASVSESSTGRGTTPKNPKPASKGNTAYKGKPTLFDALRSHMVRNTVMHKLVEDITENKDDADSELATFCSTTTLLTTMLVMVPGSAYLLLAHSVFQYNSRARQAGENHRDIIIFIGDRTMVGDPTGFIMDVDTKLEIEVECIDDDEGISDFIQDVKNDGKLLVQSESALASSNMETKKVVFMMPVNDNVAEYVVKESPSLHGLDAWINDENNDKVEDSEAAALNDWIQAAVQTDNAGKKKRKSSILAHDFQPIAGPSEELVKALESRLDVTMGGAPDSTNQPHEARGATWDVQLEQRFEAQERRLREDAKKLQSDKDSWCAMGAIIGPPGEAIDELDSPYHRCCCAVVPAEPTGCSVTANYRHEDVAQGRWDKKVLKALLVLMQDLLSASPLGDNVMPIFGYRVPTVRAWAGVETHPLASFNFKQPSSCTDDADNQ